MTPSAATNLIFRHYEIDDHIGVEQLTAEAFRGCPAPEELEEGGWVIVDSDRVVGVFVACRVDQYFGGKPIAAAAAGAWAVAPEYRGSGGGSLLMESLEDELRRQGIALAVGYPARPDFNRRFGWELMASREQYACRRDELAPKRDEPSDFGDLRVRAWGSEDLDRIRECYGHACRRGNGLIDRPLRWWDPLLAPNMYRYLVDDNHEVVHAYVAFKQDRVCDVGVDHLYDIACHDLVWRSGDGLAVLRRFLYDQGWHAQHVRWWGPRDDPMQMTLGQLAVRREAHVVMAGNLLDPAEALRQRGYPTGVNGHIELAIECPRDRPSVLLEVDVRDGGAEVRKLERVKTTVVRLHTTTMAAMFSGWLSARDAHELGRVRAREVDIDLLTTMFAGPAPWCANAF